MNVLRRRDWSPYAAGALLGVVVAVSLGIFGHRLSGAGAYQELAAPLGRAAEPHSTYFAYITQSGITWDVIVIAGGLVGGFVASQLAGTFRIRTMPDGSGRTSSVRASRGACARVRRIDADGDRRRVAGGCTASLAVSGGAALVPAAFLFMAGMFAGGIPTRWLIYRRRRP